MNESIIEYGTTLAKMAKELLPTVNTQNLTQILEKQLMDYKIEKQQKKSCLNCMKNRVKISSSA